MAEPPYSREVEDYCRRVIEALKPRSILLFGSMATGRQGLGSDVDIIVISENLPGNFLERLRLLFELNPTTAPIEALGYTPREFLRMLRRRHPTALDAVAQGKPLYDDGFLEEARRTFEEVRARFDLVRTRRGWRAGSLWGGRQTCI